MRYLKKAYSKRQKVESWLPGARGGAGGELLFNKHRISVWGDEKVLETDGGDSCTIL